MDVAITLFTLIIIVISSALLHLLTRRIQSGHTLGKRPLAGYEAVASQIGRAVESGRRVHYALGRGGLSRSAGLTSVASLSALDALTEDGCASGVPPLVTVGEPTLLPAAQDSLRRGFQSAGRPKSYSPQMAQFVASDAYPMVYAAGAGDELQHGGVGSNIMLGHFGAEIAILGEIAGRQNMDQVIGSDDPLALAVATSVSDHVLIGEEMLAASAYLHGRPNQLASLQAQDILRLILIIFILLAGLVNLF